MLCSAQILGNMSSNTPPSEAAVPAFARDEQNFLRRQNPVCGGIVCNATLDDFWLQPQVLAVPDTLLVKLSLYPRTVRSQPSPRALANSAARNGTCVSRYTPQPEIELESRSLSPFSGFREALWNQNGLSSSL